MTGFYADEWVHHLPLDMKQALARGETLVVGSKVLRVCPQCLTVIQLNKAIFGSMHFCQ